MTENKVFIDIHAIQTVPPSNINRDDTGSPKTAQYGGVTRARVSSQSWKKAIRDYFGENVINNNVGIRSLKIVPHLANEIQNLDPSIEEAKALEKANQVLKDAGVIKKSNKIEALFFISSMQTTKLAQAAIDGVTDKKSLQTILNANPSVDIALFGRMVANDATLNEDASSQVAHSISTHAVQTEFDFFTAVDDLSPEDESGAGMLGTIEFNSSTLYRYANVAAHELKKQLDDNQESTIGALKLFIEAFIKSMPTGKVNTFANQTLPQAVIVSIRSDRPVSLVTAFETPIKTGGGYVAASIQKLKDEFNKVQRFVETPVYTFTIGVDGLGEDVESLKTLIDKFGESVSSLLK